MTNYREIVDKMVVAWDEKDEVFMRTLLHEDYRCEGPAMEMNSAQECIDFMMNCPFEGSCEEHEVIVEGNKVVNAFDWVVTAPFKAVVPMVEILTFEGKKVKHARMYYNTALIPAEFAEQAA